MAHSWNKADAEAWKRLIFRANDAAITRRRRQHWTSQTMGDLARACRSARKARFPAHGQENHARLMAFLHLCEDMTTRAEGRDALTAALDRGIEIARRVIEDGEAPPPRVAAAAGRLPYRDE